MKMLIGFVISLSLIMLASCASQKAAVEKVETEIKNETVVKQGDVTANARDYITNSSKLTAEQKTSLLALQNKRLSEGKMISEEINKVKMVLIKTLMEPKVNRKEVSILKKDLRRLGKKQVESSLTAFDEARKIISPMKDQQDKEFLFNAFMMRQNNSY